MPERFSDINRTVVDTVDITSEVIVNSLQCVEISESVKVIR